MLHLLYNCSAWKHHSNNQLTVHYTLSVCQVKAKILSYNPTAWLSGFSYFEFAQNQDPDMVPLSPCRANWSPSLHMIQCVQPSCYGYCSQVISHHLISVGRRLLQDGRKDWCIQQLTPLWWPSLSTCKHACCWDTRTWELFQHGRING